jgi:hypothetical protein
MRRDAGVSTHVQEPGAPGPSYLGTRDSDNPRRRLGNTYSFPIPIRQALMNFQWMYTE